VEVLGTVGKTWECSHVLSVKKDIFEENKKQILNDQMMSKYEIV